jgi:hypothetical protein
MCQGFNETSLPQIDSATREKSKKFRNLNSFWTINDHDDYVRCFSYAKD